MAPTNAKPKKTGIHGFGNPTNSTPKKTGIHGFDNPTQGSLPAKKVSKVTRAHKRIGKRGGQILGAASTRDQNQCRPWWSDLRAEALRQASRPSESISGSATGQEAGRQFGQLGSDLRGERSDDTKRLVKASYTGSMRSTAESYDEEDIEWDDPNDKDYDEGGGEYVDNGDDDDDDDDADTNT